MLPCVFFFMKNKKMTSYKSVFERFKREVDAQYGIVFTPESILSDFEQALFKAFAIHFPTSTVRGCWFHYCQSIWRKVYILLIEY